jgi:transposase
MQTRKSKATYIFSPKVSYAGESRSRLPEKERVRIISLHDKGFSISAIARAVDCSRATVRNTLRRFKKAGTVQDKSRSGRKYLITQQEFKALLYRLDKGEVETTQECIQWLKDEFGKSVSEKTMRTTLRRHHMFNYTKQRKPYVSPENAAQ